MKKSARIIDESIMEQKQSFVSRTTDGAAVHRADQNLSSDQYLSCRPEFIVQTEIYCADLTFIVQSKIYRADQKFIISKLGIVQTFFYRAD